MRAPSRTVQNARRLRRDMSLPELLLWDCLRAGRLEGLRFRRQHAIGAYVLDFYCPAARLAVELDGVHHDFEGQMRHDNRRDDWLRREGIRVLRIAASDILDRHLFEGVLRVIAQMAATGIVPEGYESPRSASDAAPPPPPSAVPLPRKRGRIEGAAGRDGISSPAKRGVRRTGEASDSPQGTMRSMVEGALFPATEATPSPNREDFP
ncbi:DUF559 domain-containing protein [Chelativorans sp. ZYF759]|uniref:endonuclease domain-containing protein n=1 Tax=Chelativorans sp. ZYF759 TaxID=2692213 RepID=UPI00145D1074|nr:endonuclease domain-containing protein [Chelativorans sp. ZYF759]NMG41946.1 DUF559 domain-containing protein [Chelativorans sp. ZYF759]